MTRGSMRASLIVAACAVCLAAPPPLQDWSHGWETALASQFIDFGYQALTQEQAAFVATHYAIASFEKCTGPGPTEPNVYATAARVKAANPAAKVMFYWDVVSGLARCVLVGCEQKSQPVLPPLTCRTKLPCLATTPTRPLWPTPTGGSEMMLELLSMALLASPSWTTQTLMRARGG